MVIYDPKVTNSYTHGDISTTLPRDIDNGTVANDVPPPPPGLLQVEPCLVNENIFMCNSTSINLKHSERENDYISQKAYIQEH